MWLFRMRKFLKTAGKESLMLAWAVKHPNTPVALRLASLALLLYVLSPVDLVPDLPGLGWIDDAAILMFGIPFLVNRLPPQVKAEAEQVVARVLARFGAGRGAS